MWCDSERNVVRDAIQTVKKSRYGPSKFVEFGRGSSETFLANRSTVVWSVGSSPPSPSVGLRSVFSPPCLSRPFGNFAAALGGKFRRASVTTNGAKL